MTFAKVRGLADAIHGRVILYRWTLPSGEEREIIIFTTFGKDGPMGSWVH